MQNAWTQIPMEMGSGLRLGLMPVVGKTWRNYFDPKT